MFCDRCGANVPEEAEYCESCGGRLHRGRATRSSWILWASLGVGAVVSLVLLIVVFGSDGSSGSDAGVSPDGGPPGRESGEPDASSDEDTSGGEAQGESAIAGDGGVPPDSDSRDGRPLPDGPALRARVAALRARSWSGSPTATGPTELYTLRRATGTKPKDEHFGSLLWTTPSGKQVRLFVTTRWGTYEVGAGRMGSTLLMQVRGEFEGADPGGSILVAERNELAVSVTELEDIHLWASQRADGAVLIAFDWHYKFRETADGNFEELDSVAPEPGDTRRVLVVWDDEARQPLAVALWRGHPPAAPSWARMTPR